MSNPRYLGLLKVGKTKNSPEKRARQLTSQTGTLGKFTVEWCLEVPDIQISESVIHHALKQFHDEKEYFRVELDVAIQVASSVLRPLFATIEQGEKLWRLKDKAIRINRQREERQMEKEALALYKKLIAFKPQAIARRQS